MERNFKFKPVRSGNCVTMKEKIAEDAYSLQGNFPTFAQYKALGGAYSLDMITATFGNYANFFFELRFGEDSGTSRKAKSEFDKAKFLEEISAIFDSDRKGFSIALLNNYQYGTILNKWGNWDNFRKEFMLYRMNKDVELSPKVSGNSQAYAKSVPVPAAKPIITKEDMFVLTRNKWEMKGSQLSESNFTPDQLKKIRKFSGNFVNFMMEFCEWANNQEVSK